MGSYINKNITNRQKSDLYDIGGINIFKIKQKIVFGLLLMSTAMIFMNYQVKADKGDAIHPTELVATSKTYKIYEKQE